MVQKTKETRTIFDDVFRTMLQKMPSLVIPFVNEVFHTDYDENDIVLRQETDFMTENGKRIADSFIRLRAKNYHFECQSYLDQTIAIRMFEYDAAIALGTAVGEPDGTYCVSFPCSCVLYLRHNSNTKDAETVRITFSDGSTHLYTVPAVKIQDYTKDEIFQKKLLLFLPYYILRYEKQFAQIEGDVERLEAFIRDYEDIRERLQQASQKLYVDMSKMIIRVSNYLLTAQEKLQKGVNDSMGGQVLELFSEEMERREKALKEGTKALEEGTKALEEGTKALKEKTEELQQKNSELQQRDSELQQKDSELQQKNSELQQRDSELQQRDSELQQKDSELQQKDSELQQKDSELQQKDSELQQRDSELQQRDSELQQKDSELQQRDSELQRKDSELRQKELELERLRAQLAQRQESVKQEE